jgi:hypothetical protein
VPTSDRDPLNVPVIIKPHVWREEVERVDVRSLARIAAEREWSRLEDEGLALG